MPIASARPKVRLALVPAASRLTAADGDNDPKRILRVDGTEIIIHTLKSLASVGIERTVVTLGHKGHIMAAAIEAECFGDMVVQFVWCDATYCRGHASNLMTARSMFKTTDPFLIVMSDHLFDPALLARFAEAPMQSDNDAVALVDDTEDYIKWSKEDHCGAFCKNGHCNRLVKVLLGEGGRIARIGKRLTAYDALEAGAYLVRPTLFEVLGQLLSKAVYCTLVDAMQLLAESGRLRYVSTEGLNWYSELTVCSLQQPDFVSKAVKAEWRDDAKELLCSVGGVASATGYSATDGGAGGANGGSSEREPEGSFSRRSSNDSSMKRVLSFIKLGEEIGEGASSKVMQAESRQDMDDVGSGESPSMRCENEGGKKAGQDGQLAVKMVRHTGDGPVGDQERLAMWELHVLQQLNHPHIVKVHDVIELVDATYIVMERVDGPELGDFISRHPGGRLPPECACRIFSQLLSSLQHAHAAGYLHCDIKPANIRLSSDCDFAVLTDWGFARQLGSSPCSASLFGSPAYAPPEQLTGYCPDGISGGQRKLCAAADVWSLGATLHEMLVGCAPFGGESFDALVRNVIHLNYLQSFPEDVPTEAVELVHSMLQVGPVDRATVHELCSSKWVSSSGFLPEQQLPSDQIGIMCDDCEDDPKVHSTPWRQRLQTLRPRFMLVFYASVCAYAVAMYATHGAHGGFQLEYEEG